MVSPTKKAAPKIAMATSKGSTRRNRFMAVSRCPALASQTQKGASGFRKAWPTHLGAQSSGRCFVRGNAICDNTSAAAFATAQPLHESCNRRIRLYGKTRQRLIAQNALVPANQTAHLHDELGRFHNQPSSASRMTRSSGFSNSPAAVI